MREMIENTTERDDELERRIDESLAQAPVLTIPADFAARVAALVPAQQEVAIARPTFGRNTVLVCAAVLLIALLIVAPHATGKSVFATGIEWILCAQLSLLGLWFALSRSPWRLGP